MAILWNIFAKKVEKGMDNALAYFLAVCYNVDKKA